MRFMAGRQRLGRPFGWLWAAYAVSAYGTGFGFGAFSLIAIRVLHCGPGQVSALSAAGMAAGARWPCRSAQGSSSAASGR